jgi:hypothetical protein
MARMAMILPLLLLAYITVSVSSQSISTDTLAASATGREQYNSGISNGCTFTTTTPAGALVSYDLSAMNKATG